MEAAAASANIELFTIDADGRDSYPAAYSAIRAAGGRALVIGPNPTFFRDAAQLAALALEAAEAGGVHPFTRRRYPYLQSARVNGVVDAAWR